MRKKILLLLFIVAALLLFWPLTSPRVVAVVLRKCVKGLQAEKIYRLDGQYVIDNLSVEGEGISFKAERAYLDPVFHPFSLSLELNVVIDKSRFNFDRPIDLRLCAAKLFSRSPLPFLRIDNNLTLGRSVILWREKEGENYQQKRASLNIFIKTGGDSGSVRALLSLDGGETKNNTLSLRFIFEGANKKELEARFFGVDLARLYSASEVFGLSFGDWRVHGGIADGRVGALLQEERRNYSWGSLSLKNLCLINSDKNIIARAEEANIALEKDLFGSSISNLFGRVELIKGASLTINQKGHKIWEINDFLGYLELDRNFGARVDFLGNCYHNDRRFALNIKGDYRYFDKDAGVLDLLCCLRRENGKDAAFKLVARKLGSLNHVADVRIENISREEMVFVQTAAGRYFPNLNSIQIIDGYFNGQGTCYFRSFNLTDIRINKFRLEDLKVAFNDFDAIIDIKRADGSLSLDLHSPRIMESLNANLRVYNGFLEFYDNADQSWRFRGLGTDIEVKNGILQQSVITGEFAALKGTVVINWLSGDNLAFFDFSGRALDIKPFLPQKVAKIIDSSFADESIRLTGNLSLRDSFASFKGEALAYREDLGQGQKVSFSFDLLRRPDKFRLASSLKSELFAFWRDAVPPLISPCALCQVNSVKMEIGAGGYVIRNGSFIADNIPLEKTLTHLIYPDGDGLISGLGSFRGYFDSHLIAIDYEGQDICIENKFFKIEADIIKKREGVRSAPFYYYGLDRGNYFSLFPLTDARYLEKRSGNLFREINATVILEGDMIHIPELELSCRDIYMSGSLDLNFDFPGKDIFDLDIMISSIAAKVADARDFLVNFDKDFFPLDIPLDGDLRCSDRGCRLTLACGADSYDLQVAVGIEVRNGTVCLNNNVFMDDLEFKFDYDDSGNSLAITELSGEIRSVSGGGKPLRVVADTLRFNDLRKMSGGFDIWLGDSSRDLIRLVGRAALADTGGGAAFFEVDFNDERTHFGNIHPKEFKALLRNWNNLEYFRIAFDTTLPTLIKDFKSVCGFGLVTLSADPFNKINPMRDAGGELSFDLMYDAALDTFNVVCRGEDLFYLGFPAKAFMLNGYLKGNQLLLEKLKIDAIEASGQLSKKRGDWLLDNFSFRYNDVLSLIISGAWKSDGKVLQAAATNFNLKLEELGKISNYFTDERVWEIKGDLYGTGSLQVDLTEGLFNPRVDIALDAYLKNCIFEKWHFRDARNVSCHYNSERGISVRHLETSLRDPDGSGDIVKLNLGVAGYEFQNGDFALEDLSFALPAENLPKLAAALADAFPEVFSPRVCRVIEECKKVGMVQGTVQFELNRPYSATKLVLADDQYTFFDKTCDLRNFVFECDPYEFRVCTAYNAFGNLFWVLGRSGSPTLDFGEAWVAGDKDDLLRNDNALYICWENRENSGFDILEARGYLSGLRVNLRRATPRNFPEDSLSLKGDVSVDPLKAASLLSEAACEKIEELGIGAEYRLSGDWFIKDEVEESLLDSFTFNGTLNAGDFIFRGYEFERLASRLTFDQGNIMVNDLTVNDLSGSIKIAELNCHRDVAELWRFRIPVIEVGNFRPSLLKEAGRPRPVKAKPLVVKNLILRNWEGILGDSSTYTGQGSLYFTNKSKSILHNTIFQIPKDILARIGLDPAVLTPVRGGIDYYLRNGKIILSKFKEIYSDGKLSKFNLAEGPSYVDFDGQLNVTIRMKQHNLLFKLAELFTVSIRGTFDKPFYSLRKHKSSTSASP